MRVQTVRWLVAFTGWCLLGLVLAEGGLRLGIEGPRASVPDAVHGQVMRPHAVVVESGEGWSRSTTNAHGYLDAAPRPASARRLVVVGDSFTAAPQVARRLRYADRLEAAVQGLDVVHAAQPGWSPANGVFALRRWREELAVHAVVVQVNDGDWPEVLRPRFAHVEAGPDGLRLAPAELGGGLAARARRLAIEVATWSAVANRLLSRGQLLIEQQLDRLDDAPAEPEPPAPEVRPPPSADQRAAMAHVFGALAAEGAPVLVLQLPRLEHFDGPCHPSWPASTAAYAEAAARAGVAFFDATDPLCEVVARTGQPVLGFHNGQVGEGHVNAAGHEALAQALEPRVRAMLVEAAP